MRYLIQISLVILLALLINACKKDSDKCPYGKALVPANPNASQSTTEVLNYLGSLTDRSNNRVLSGQNIDNSDIYLDDHYKRYFRGLYNITGQYPGLMAVVYSYGEVPDLSAANQYMIEHWQNKGLVTINFTTPNPFTGVPGFDNTVTDYELLFTEGSKEQKKWFEDLDKIAAGLQELQEHGVVVILHPLYEMNGGWSWWCSNHNGWTTQDQFKRLWIQLFDYFTYKKGLNNLLWLYGPNYIVDTWGAPEVDHYYPGDAYVDITGLSYYNDNMDTLGMYGNYQKMVGLGKPFGLIEYGPVKITDGSLDNSLLIKSIKSKYPRTCFFAYWNHFSGLQLSIVANQNANELMNDPWVVNRGEVELCE